MAAGWFICWLRCLKSCSRLAYIRAALVDGRGVDVLPAKGLPAHIDSVVEASSRVLDQVGAEDNMTGFIFDMLGDHTGRLGSLNDGDGIVLEAVLAELFLEVVS